MTTGNDFISVPSLQGEGRRDSTSRMYRNVQKQTSSESTEIIESLKESNLNALFHPSICLSVFQPAFLLLLLLLFPHPLQIPFLLSSKSTALKGCLISIPHHLVAYHTPLLPGTHRSLEPFIFVRLSLLVLLQIKPVTLILLPSSTLFLSLVRGEERRERGWTNNSNDMCWCLNEMVHKKCFGSKN